MFKIKPALELVKLIFRCLIPMTFLVVGYLMFSSSVRGWNLIFGLPLILFGAVFLLHTYDEVIARNIKPFRNEVVRCIVCGDITPRLPRIAPEDTICKDCQDKVKKGIKSGEKE